MNRGWMWFWMSCKRFLRKPAFLGMLLLFPLVCFFIRSTEKKEQTVIAVAVCALSDESGDSLESALASRLIAQSEAGATGLFRFYRCETEEQLRDEVASRRAESGYVLESGLRERLDTGTFKRSIRVYAAPSTVTAELSAEVVLAELIAAYDRELFSDYVREAGLFDQIAPPGSAGRAKLADEAGALYDKWSSNDSTFRFAYEWTDRAGAVAETHENRVFPVRGLVAVYVFVTGLYSAVMSIRDERKGLFLSISYRYRTSSRVAALAGPVCLAAASGLLALGASGAVQDPVRELLVMAVYVLMIAAFSWALRLVCRREEILCGLIPFFLVGSLVFCPVFVDAARFLPELRLVERLFLPGYYLRFFF